MTCACRVEERGSRSEPYRIVYCPLHAAAPKLLEVARDALAALGETIHCRALRETLQTTIEFAEGRPDPTQAVKKGRFLVFRIFLGAQSEDVVAEQFRRLCGSLDFDMLDVEIESVEEGQP